MIVPRRTNQFDNFMIPSPKPEVSPRRIPLKNINNYQTNPIPPKNNLSNRYISPNNTSNSRKPLISPSRSPRRQPQKEISRQIQYDSRTSNVDERYCSNESHPHKRAQYYIHIQDEDMYYCGVCATQAASQGFTVNEICSASVAESKRVRTLPHCPQYANNPRFLQICDLLKGISSLQSKYNRMNPHQVSDHYRGQEQLLNQFYQQMLTLVQTRRNEHLAQLQKQRTQKCQLVTFGQQNLKIHMDELNEVWEDMVQNLQEIIQHVEQYNFQTCMNQYHNTLELSKHKLDQYGDQIKNVITLNQEELSQKIKRFEEGIEESLNYEGFRNVRTVKHVGDAKKGGIPLDRNKSVKKVHENLPRSHNNNLIERHGKVAFRTLFGEDQDEEKIPEASPQFKAF